MADSFDLKMSVDANHTALKVRDLQTALDFYHRLIGLPILRTRGPENNLDSVWLPGLQLVVDPGVRESGALDHVALGVDNIEELCARLDEAGTVVDTPLQTRTKEDVGRELKMAFYIDPEGNKVEILKYLD